MGGAWSETISAPARHEEAATDGATSFKEVAQAAQVESLPDLDHARHLFEVSTAVPAATIKKATSGRVYDLERPLF